jgi:RNA polymerase sigma-54 factor
VLIPMQIGLFQAVRMEQRLVQSPQMIQAMLILQLSSLDLQERIEQELLENPLLERVEGQRANDAGDVPDRTAEAARPEALDAVLAMREHDRWDPDLRERRGTSEESNRKHEAMQNSPDCHHSLGDSLLDQLALIELDPRQHEIVEFIVFSLDARGYLPCSLTLLAEGSGIAGATEEEFALLLEEIRHATHPALGALDLQECLLLQVGERVEGDSLLRTLITEKLADVAANRLPRIAQSTGHSIAEVGQAIALLRTLDACPGNAYGAAPAEVIRPDVVVEEIDGAFQVRLRNGSVSGLRISADYAKLVREAPRGDRARKWIRERLGSARWFIHALEQRQETLLRTARAIFERQHEFLEKGRGALRPMRMHEVADAAGVHLSTVSRAVSGKYVQTSQGILPLRSFFTSGMAKAGGGAVTQRSIQEQVRLLIEEEDPSDPLSDDRLAGLLLERGGVSLARRTVTKYRKVLAIPSSSRRRVY